MIKNFIKRRRYEWHLNKIERLNKLVEPYLHSRLNFKQINYHLESLNKLSGLGEDK